jgi:hypothetical protein
MTEEQRQELRDLLKNLSEFESNAEVFVLMSDIQEALKLDITLREYKKIKKRARKRRI